ncbi:MAG: TRAP transporter small permease [Desulfobacterales bacterium]|jgi:TRAP-type C4-dicarboxylate transport system permease small subunit|nr:TRAP transporter small permease [Desulfobacterales bacterium]
MENLRQISGKLSLLSEKAVYYTLVVMMIVMTLTVIVQVFLRYVFSFSLSWSEEVARYLMIWVAFLGGSLALQKGLHIGVELFLVRVSSRTRRWVSILSKMFILIFLIYLTIGGLKITWAVRDQSSPALLFSMAYAYLSAPVGGFFMALQTIHSLIEDWGRG